MLKVLSLLILILSMQSAFANDFLLKGKQLLVCEEDEVLFRINWEDWDVENKSFGVRSRDKLIKFVLSVDREDAENNYQIQSEFVKYKNGEVVTESRATINVGPFLGDGSEPDFRYHYIDKDKGDAEIKKICKN